MDGSKFILIFFIDAVFLRLRMTRWIVLFKLTSSGIVFIFSDWVFDQSKRLVNKLNQLFDAEFICCKYFSFSSSVSS
jgi:hypothetical protein